VQPAGGGNEQALQAEIARLNKMILALMNRAERNASIHGSDFNLFHTAITLEDQVRRRTAELEAALLENEKITRALRTSENRHRLLVENSPMCIHEIDLNGRIASMNRAGLGMMGINEEREVQGYLYLDAVCEADRERIAELLAKAYAGETSHFEFKADGASGQMYKSCFVPIKNKNGDVEKLMGITEDITERKQAEEQIRSFAFYDPLTQLANRRLLNDRLGQAMAAGKRSLCYGAVIFLDLDNFKSLNDTHGHEMGDLLLIEVARRLTRCVREMDTVARFGGDEFVVMLGELDVNKERSAEQAANVAEKIRVALAEPYLLVRNFCQLNQPEGGGEVASGNAVPVEIGVATPVEHHCTSSIGVVLFVGNEASQEDILKWADMAMYQAKEGGRGRVRFFSGKS
jgi:diguanylate cyclase (GGDEF)-like protein/PAS domain S-box-containing protein